MKSFPVPTAAPGIVQIGDRQRFTQYLGDAVQQQSSILMKIKSKAERFQRLPVFLQRHEFRSRKRHRQRRQQRLCCGGIRTMHQQFV